MLSGHLWKPEACGQTALTDRSLLKRVNIGGKCQDAQILKRKSQHFEQLSNNMQLYFLKLK